MQGIQSSRFDFELKLLRRRDGTQTFKRTTRPFASSRNHTSVLDRPPTAPTIIVNPRPRFSPLVREDRRAKNWTMIDELEALAIDLVAQIEELEGIKGQVK